MILRVVAPLSEVLECAQNVFIQNVCGISSFLCINCKIQFLEAKPTILPRVAETKPFWSWHFCDFWARKISFFEIGKFLCVSKGFWRIKMIEHKISGVLKKTRGPYHIWASQKLQKTSVTTAQLIRQYIRLYKGIWAGFGTIPLTIFTKRKNENEAKNLKFKKDIFL